MLDVIAPYMNLEINELDRFMNLTAAEREFHPIVRDILGMLDVELLRGSMLVVKEALEKELPSLVEELKSRYQLSDFPLSSFMLVNWVLGFLKYPSEVHRLSEIHQNVDWNIIFETIPHILEILDHLPDGIRDNWKKVFSLMAMFVGARA